MNKQVTTNTDIPIKSIQQLFDIPSGKTRAWKFEPNVFISKLLTAFIKQQINLLFLGKKKFFFSPLTVR